MEQKKEFWIVFIINFFLPGGGHIYAGDTNKGVVLLVTDIIVWTTVSIFVFPLIVALGIWAYALYDSKKVVEMYNQKIEMKKVAEEQEKANTITPEKFVSLMKKANQLLVADAISKIEFQERKQAIISDLQFKKFKGEKDDLLLSISKLKKDGTVNEEELQQIKKILNS